MDYILPFIFGKIGVINKISRTFKFSPILRRKITNVNWYVPAILLDLIIIFLLIGMGKQGSQSFLPFLSPVAPLHSLTKSKSNHEVFGFAPYWNLNRMDNVDFNILTTFAYFGIPVNGEGVLDESDPGYEAFQSKKATELFRKAHARGTRVVLTLTQMDNNEIEQLMDNPQAQESVIRQSVAIVNNRGIDGINVDFEYMGDPGQNYRNKFSAFISRLTEEMHRRVPSSRVTVSVYASAVKDPKIYDIAYIGRVSDGIFMMAYDFAVAGSDNAIPTAPLYGHKEGKYWYDIDSAVKDFLTLMPANKLILGVPYYGYNYVVYEPHVKAETRPYYSWRGKPTTQTYTLAKENLTPTMEGIDNYRTGWDIEGQVSYIAYHVTTTDTWRMIFIDDERSLAVKYDYVKKKELAGVGMWALGFDEGRKELWTVLEKAFGEKIADNRIAKKTIREIVN